MIKIKKLEEKLLTISQLVGQPVMFHIGIKDDKIEIFNIDKCSEEENEEGIPIILNKKIKINKPFTYIG